jgi:hypothetical protein
VSIRNSDTSWGDISVQDATVGQVTGGNRVRGAACRERWLPTQVLAAPPRLLSAEEPREAGRNFHRDGRYRSAPQPGTRDDRLAKFATEILTHAVALACTIDRAGSRCVAWDMPAVARLMYAPARMAPIRMR